MGQLKPVDQSCDECDRVVLLNTNTHIKVSEKKKRFLIMALTEPV